MRAENNLQQIIQEQINFPTKLLSDYTKLGMNEEELIVVLQLLAYARVGNYFPTPDQLARVMTINETTCAQYLRQLMQKGLLSIVQTEDTNKQRSENYQLEPLWQKLFAENKTEKKPERNEEQDANIFVLFEQEFGRPLSPFEIEMINAWLDEDLLSTALIKAALREAVLMTKLNFKYIDRILREWKKKGIKNVEQARKSSQQFHKPTYSNTPENTNRDTSFYYNWLEGDD